jgi:O-antigen/teichoic acid export membrane protein
VALAAYFGVMAECGLFPYLTSTLPLLRGSPGASDLLSQGVMLRFILGLIIAVIFLAVGFISGKPIEVKIFVALLAATLLFNNIMGGFYSALYGFERFGFYGLLSAGAQIVGTGLTFMALYYGFGLVGIGAALLATTAVACVVAATFVSTKVCRPSPFSFTGLFELFKKAAPFGIMTILVVFYYRANFAILSFLKGDEAIGYYNAAFAIVAGIVVLTTTFGATLLPRMSKLYSDDRDGLMTLYRKAFRYLMLAGLGIAFGGMAISKNLMTFLYSPLYAPSAGALSALVWVSALTFTNPLQGSLLVVRNSRRHLVIMSALGALCSIIMGFIMIPHFSFVGAGIALLLSELIIWVYSFILNREFLPLQYLISILWRALVAAAAMVLILSLVHNSSAIWLILLGATIYIGMLFTMRALLVEDVRLISRTIGLSGGHG